MRSGYLENVPLTDISAVPLRFAAPALLAGGAWLNARTQLGYDWTLITGFLKTEIAVKANERKGRLNLFYQFEQHAITKSSADRVFLVFEDKSWTYGQAYHIVLSYGTWFKTRHGINSGDVVALDSMNSATFVFLWLGLWSIGARPAFINYNLTGEALIHSIRSSTARLLIVEDALKSNFPPHIIDVLSSPLQGSGRSAIHIVYFSSSLHHEIVGIQGVREPDSSRDSIKAHDMAILIYTSGTTGLPKPATVSWRKCTITSVFMPHWMPLKSTDRFYTSMPLYHSSASLLGLIPVISAGATICVGRRFSTSTFWSEVRACDATIIQYVGETLRYLLAAPPQLSPSGTNLDKLHKVRVAFGNGLRPDVWERFKSRFGIETIAEFYSATEGVSATWNRSSNQFTSGAIGRNGTLSSFFLQRDIALVVIDWIAESPKRDPSNNNFCIKAKVNEPAELLYKLDPLDTNAKFQGYFNSPEATDSKILRDVLVKGDAYFRTGDVLRWDSEGRWWFCDRIGDTFRWKSENVSTAEVGECLGAHPHVLEANVYGVEVPHHDGRAGCAAILFDAEKGEVTDQLLRDVARHGSENLPKYAVPAFLRVVKTVVATGNNKQQKAGLRKDGIEPEKMGEDRMYWLQGGSYVPFKKRQYEELKAGSSKL